MTKKNSTDIRSISVSDVSVMRSVFATGITNAQTSWAYLLGGTYTRPTSTPLTEGVLIRNIGSLTGFVNAAVIGIEGKTFGIFNSTAGNTADGFALSQGTEIFLPSNDLATIVFKAAQGTANGLSLSYRAN